MTLTQRRLHLLLWLLIGPIVGVLFVLAILWRPAPPVQPGVAPGSDTAEQAEGTP